MKIASFLVLMSLALPACPKNPVPPTPDVADASMDDAATDDDAAASKYSCAAWCKHAATLQCVAAQDTSKGAHCVDVCNNVQTNNPKKFNLKCRVLAKTCADAEQCE